MTLNGVMALILRYFTEFGSFGAHVLRKSGWTCRRKKVHFCCLCLTVVKSRRLWKKTRRVCL